MSVSFLLLGTNMGDKTAHLLRAKQFIGSEIGNIITVSSIYSTKAWGIENQDDFLNQVIQVETHMNPNELLKCCLAIEKKLGRVRYEKWGRRIIDIDILYFDKEIIRTKDLVVPHPELQNRKFTLVPLVEISPEWLHPVLKVDQRELLNNCEDSLEVEVY